MTSFPLPRASQEQYTLYYQKVIKKGALSNYKVVWPGAMLECRFKADSIKDLISPMSVFIVARGKEFEYAVLDNRKTFFKLPKKYYTLCFPNISLSAVPQNNRMRVQVTGTKVHELPYIPKSFLELKKLKTTRKRRRTSTNISPPAKRVENIDFSCNDTPSWHVLLAAKGEDKLLKKQIVETIRSIILKTDETTITLRDPFESLQNITELQTSAENVQLLKIIVSFIYHYCRAELGLNFSQEPIKISEALIARLSA